jgi:hypothetical protein
MNRKTRAIIKSVCCENLSNIEAAMVFKCSVDDIQAEIDNAMQESGHDRHDLWLVIRRPNLSLFNHRRRGTRATTESSNFRFKPFQL